MSPSSRALARRRGVACYSLQTKEEVDLAFLGFGAAFDSIRVESGKISGQVVDEALFFHHFPLRTRIGQAGKIPNVVEHNLHIEVVAANPNFYRTLRISRNLLDSFVDNRTHPFDILRRELSLARLLEEEIVKGFCGDGPVFTNA